jgi:hypothetical protein
MSSNVTNVVQYLHTQKQPLVSLEYRIKEKYSVIFSVDELSQVSVRDGILKAVEKFERAPKVKAEKDAPRITATITITNADVESVQHFLWDLALKGIREKFEFVASTENAPRHLRKPDISVNAVDAYLSQVYYAFKYLEIGPHPLADPIGLYLVSYLLFNLKAAFEGFKKDEDSDGDGPGDDKPQTDETAVDDSKKKPDIAESKPKGMPEFITEEEKMDIIRNLKDLFETEDYLEKHADICFKNVWWFIEEFETLSRCLDEKDVIGHVSKGWLRLITSSARPKPGYLRPWVARMAENWLRRTTWSALEAWRWVQVFYRMVGGPVVLLHKQCFVPN